MEISRPMIHGTVRWSLGLAIGIGWIAAVASAGRANSDTPHWLGFTAESAARQQRLEEQFDSLLRADDLRTWLEFMSAAPNHVGSPHNRTNAEFMLQRFREWGWDAHLEEVSVLYPTPQEIGLEMLAPVPFVASLKEPPVAGDRTSDRNGEGLPPYHAYGADGDVTADLIYVNQGMPSDYKQLDRLGLSVQGRIVIARYGGGWRGLKPKLAFEHGAVGCLIYSDPHDDGYAVGDVYPTGAHRPPAGVQRGSVLDLPVSPGDPLTPGVGATEHAHRLPIAEAGTLAKIPVLPISYADARPLLEALRGPVASPAWRGSLPITYHLGPGPARVRLRVRSDWSLKPLYNVVATLRGKDDPDQWVIRGNHHDGWVYGAWDPLSANVALMSEAKAIGALLKQGWQPKRTLIYVSWDGEEPGLLGSTEWVETHAEELREKAVVYVNSDTNGRGFFRAGGSHSLQTLVNQVAGGVLDPETGSTVLARLRAKLMVEERQGDGDDEDRDLVKRLSSGDAPPLEALGSGSDYSPFLQHIGIASLDIRFGGEDQDAGIYHSAYDSFDHYLRFGDPGMVYGVVLAKVVGHTVLRVANSDVLPFQFGSFAEAAGRYLEQVRQLTDRLRERTQRQHRLLDEKAYQLAADPTEVLVPPPRESDVPFLNFSPLENAMLRLTRIAAECDGACGRASGGTANGSVDRLRRLNHLIQGAEQALTWTQGLPRRAWYRHMIYAPGLETGYGVKTFPGVREALEDRNWSEAEEYIRIIATVISSCSDRLEAIKAAAEPE